MSEEDKKGSVDSQTQEQDGAKEERIPPLAEGVESTEGVEGAESAEGAVETPEPEVDLDCKWT